MSHETASGPNLQTGVSNFAKPEAIGLLWGLQRYCSIERHAARRQRNHQVPSSLLLNLYVIWLVRRLTGSAKQPEESLNLVQPEINHPNIDVQNAEPMCPNRLEVQFEAKAILTRCQFHRQSQPPHKI